MKRQILFGTSVQLTFNDVYAPTPAEIQALMVHLSLFHQEARREQHLLITDITGDKSAQLLYQPMSGGYIRNSWNDTATQFAHKVGNAVLRRIYEEQGHSVERAEQMAETYIPRLVAA